MVNKLFALASVSALSGVVVAASASGCSSTQVITEQVDSGHDARAAIGDNEEPVAPQCMVDQVLDATSVPYLPARVEPGSCTLQVIKTLEDLVANKPDGLPFSDVKKAIQGYDPTYGPKCAACVFAAATDHWAPIVEDGSNVIVNTGGCMEVVSGNTACGKAWQQFDTCTNYGCQNCSSDADKQNCYGAVGAPGGPCEAATTAVKSACGSNLVNYVNTCYPDGELTIAGPIKKQCIEGTPTASDAGQDG
jgi:hypothetical protein